MSLFIFIPGRPQPKERARKGKGRSFYTPDNTRNAHKTIGYAMLAVRPKNWPLDAKYRVVARIRGAHGNSDGDNLLKIILDSGRGILWRNDTLRYIPDGRWIAEEGDVGTAVEVEIIEEAT